MPPLNVERYGKGACLHVAPTGVRRVCRTTELPKQPKHSVRLILISDTHSQLDAITIPPGDILCHTGDITFCARGGRTALADFNEQLRSLPHEHKVVIAGNHDKRIEQLGAEQVRKLLTAAHYLENNGVRLCGLSFWGCPYSPYKRKSSNTAFQYADERQRTIMGRIPTDVDVLLTHAARGSPHLRKAVERVRPLLHAHGHDHDEHGATVRTQGRARPHQVQRGPMKVRSIRVNAAICNRFYKPVQLPVVVDLDQGAVDRARSTKEKAKAKSVVAAPNATKLAGKGAAPRNGARLAGKNATKLGGDAKKNGASLGGGGGDARKNATRPAAGRGEAQRRPEGGVPKGRQRQDSRKQEDASQAVMGPM